MPGFFRRLAAVIYDSLLLVAVLFIATAAVLPFNGGEAFTADQYYYLLYLLFVSFLFFGWFWTHGGQTLGLRAWKIKLTGSDGGGVTWKQALVRFSCALLSWAVCGLGFFWILFDKKKRAWHDLLSNSHIRYQNQKP